MHNRISFFTLIITLLGVSIQFLGGAQPVYQLPIEGQYGEDFIIVNYVDWGPGDEVHDLNCNTKTYNGHQGTDYQLRSFATMDEGILVLAADSGLVIFVEDQLFDREKEANPSKGLGNYIGILHFDKYATYYGHLRTNSALVQPGDTVHPGMPIALVGSSGNSSDPHLHFEVWYDSMFVVDPYAGVCGNSSHLWQDPLPYDTTYGLWTSGLVGFIPSLDTLREEPARRDTFYPSDEAISYWSINYGMREGDELEIRWIAPDQSLWFTYSLTLDQDFWYYYYWSYVDFPMNGPEGLWSVQFLRNGSLADQLNFHINKVSSSLSNTDNVGELRIRTLGHQLVVTGIEDAYFYTIFNSTGQSVTSGNNIGNNGIMMPASLPTGIYYLKIMDTTGRHYAQAFFWPGNP